MNVVLETLFLRRPRIEYTSAPVCPIHFSASGIAIFDQCFNDLQFCSANKINTNFLNFQEPSDGLAYNVYYSTQETGQSFQLVNDGLPPNTAVVFTAGLYWFTVNTAAGESDPFPPSVAPGDMYTRISIPQTSDAVSWNLYKDGTKIISEFTGAIVESSAEGWYQATKITADGETPLSGCSALLLSGTVPAPPPPPPPPPPGPDWLAFAYGIPMCIGCVGEHISGPWAASGGFSPPGTGFSVFAQVIGGNSFENTVNEDGFVTGTYTGPTAHCRLSLSITKNGTLSANNEILVSYNNAPLVQLNGDAIASGSFDFTIPASVGAVIRLHVQQQAFSNQSLTFSGVITNIP